jgi:hypothetical protein
MIQDCNYDTTTNNRILHHIKNKQNIQPIAISSSDGSTTVSIETEQNNIDNVIRIPGSIRTLFYLLLGGIVIARG